MAKTELLNRPDPFTGRRHVAIVASLYNGDYVQGLIDNCLDELTGLVPHAARSVYRVPGAFEIPVAVAEVLATRKPDVLIALGVIIQGATAHADLVAESVTASLQRQAETSRVPIIHEVLLVQSAAQAEERTLQPRLNRGREAARAAVNMLELFSRMRAEETAG
jgi:6,7-dimethyl-8-ribityllumazine synthase